MAPTAHNAPALVPNSRRRATASFNSTFARGSPLQRQRPPSRRRANAYWFHEVLRVLGER
jgi:hypothetical protein